MPSHKAQHAVASLLHTTLNTPSLCSPLSGPFTKTAHFLSTLLTSPLSHVQLTAYKALAGAASVGPAALRSKCQGLLCERSLLLTVITQGLAAKDSSKALAAQLLQAVAVGGEDCVEGRACLAPWLVWLACYEQDHLVGGAISGIISLLQEWRYLSVSCLSLRIRSCSGAWPTTTCLQFCWFLAHIPRYRAFYTHIHSLCAGVLSVSP